MKRFIFSLSMVMATIASGCGISASAQTWGSIPAHTRSVAKDADQQRQVVENFHKIFGNRPAISPSAIETVNLEKSFDTEQMLVAQRPARVMHRSATDPKGNLYFVAPVSKIPGVPERWGAYGTIDPQTARLTTIYKSPNFLGSEQEYMSQSGVVRDNILYIPSFVENMIEKTYTIQWKRINILTGEALAPLDFGADTSAYLYSMTYDPTTDRIYGVSMDLSTAVGGKLIVVDCAAAPSNPADWKCEWRGGDFGGKEGNYLTGICYNPLTRKLIGIKDDYRLYEIDPVANTCVMVAEFDDASEFYTKGTAMNTTPLCYSPRDKAFVSIHNAFSDSGVVSTLYFIDAEEYTTSVCEDCEISPMAYIASLHCYDAFAPDKAPDAVENFTVSAVPGSVDFTYSFTVPTTTYDGLAIAAGQKVKVSVMLGTTEILAEEFEAGAQVERTYTGTTGDYSVTATPSIGGLEGPKQQAHIYLGNDNPLPPTGLKLDGYTLTWQAAEPKGAHGGYVQEDAIGYDIYLNARTKVNTEPVMATEFTLPEIAKLTRTKISVKSVANSMESEPSAELNVVYGPGMPMPVQITPTALQANLFEIYDANHNGKAGYRPADTRDMWAYASGIKPNKAETATVNAFFVTIENYATPLDEWLFLPATAFDDADKQYSMGFDYVNYYNNASHLDDLEIFIGKRADVKSMTSMIYSHEAQVHALPSHIQFNFVVPEAGDYIIGIHAKSGGTSNYRGVKIYNFNIEMNAEASANTPGAPTEVKISTNPEDPAQAFIDFIAPTVSALNTPLDPSVEVTVKAECEDLTASTTLLPGAEGRIVIGIPEDGVQNFVLTTSNESGRGLIRNFSAYVGQDAPSSPLNVKGTLARDNMSIKLTWDAPTTGLKGGYINPAELVYDIYSVNGIDITPLGSTSELEYTYTPAVESQARYYIGAVARNAKGMSRLENYVYEMLGRPHALPMYEKFTTPFAYGWSYNTNGSFGNAPWSHANSFDGMGIGNPKSADNAMFYSSCLDSKPTWSELIAQKASTKGVDEVAFNVTYWDYANACKMQLWGRNADQLDEQLVAEFEPKRNATGKWENWTVLLPKEYCNNDWIQLNLRAYHANPESLCIIDDYRISANIESDFKVNSVSGPYAVIVGESHTFTSSLTNSGTTSSRAEFKVELLGDDEVLAVETYKTNRIPAGETISLATRFEMKTEYLKCKKTQVRTTVTAASDEIAANNVAEIQFQLKDHVTPVITDLQGEWRDGDIQLTWSAPDATYGQGDEGFECMPAFERVDKIGAFRNIDLDGMNPYVLGMDVYRWAGDDQPSAWVVYDAAAKEAMDFDNLRPATGTQMIMARSIPETKDEYNNLIPHQASDWLVSPEIVGGSKVSFDMLCLINTNEYKETIELYYSTTDDTVDPAGITTDADGKRVCGSFKHLRNFTKSGVELWETCAATLPKDAKYFALVYRSIGQFGACIDDLQYTPTQLSQWEIRSYNVVHEDANGKRSVIEQDLADCQHRLPTPNDTAARTYYVTTNVTRDGVNVYTSPLSNGVRFEAGSGVEVVADAAAIAGGKQQIFFGGYAGQTAAVYSTDGKYLATVQIDADRYAYNISAGVYVIKVGKSITKVYVR